MIKINNEISNNVSRKKDKLTMKYELFDEVVQLNNIPDKNYL